MPFLTIITPTYNRALLLPRLYNSLKIQTCFDFEWIIIDDGSTDNTEQIINKKLESRKSKFKVRFYKKENGGKHTAINLGVKLAEGDLIFIADSDDILPKDSVKTVKDIWSSIKDDSNFAGLCGLDSDFNHNIIGSTLPESPMDITYRQAEFNYNIKGDKKEVFLASILKRFPFPEIEGEKFCPEDLIWNRISSEYKLRYFNKVIYLVEYQNDGLSSNIIKARMKSPISTIMTYQEMTKYDDIPFITKIKSAINYWRFRLCINKRTTTYRGELPKLKGWMNIVYPLGWIMHKRDKALTSR